jgi:hypothetical protein
MTACVDDVTQVTCWPGSHAEFNPQTNTTQCFCNTGLVWNSTKTACVDPQDLVKTADCSGYPGSQAVWNDKTQRVECQCPVGKKWNATMTACIDINDNGNNNGGGNNGGDKGYKGDWVLVSTTVSPADPNAVWKDHSWSYSPDGNSAHYSIYNGDYTADYNWSKPPSSFGVNGFTVTIGVSAKAARNQAISGNIIVSSSGLTSNIPSDQQVVNLGGSGSINGSKSVNFKPDPSASEVVVKVGFGWAVTYTYTYKRK